MTKKLLGVAVLMGSLGVSAVASADVAPDPCEDSTEGAACETFDGKAGLCEDRGGGGRSCSEDSATTSSTGSGGEGGSGEGGGPTTQEKEDDGGCSVASAVGSRTAAGSMTLFGLAVMAGARLAGRRRKNG